MTVCAWIAALTGRKTQAQRRAPGIPVLERQRQQSLWGFRPDRLGHWWTPGSVREPISNNHNNHNKNNQTTMMMRSKHLKKTSHINPWPPHTHIPVPVYTRPHTRTESLPQDLSSYLKLIECLICFKWARYNYFISWTTAAAIWDYYPNHTEVFICFLKSGLYT